MLTAVLVLGLSLGAVDTAQTLYWTAQPAYIEANPIWTSTAQHPTAVAVIKTSLDTAVVVTVARVGRQHPRRALLAAVVFATIKGAVVYHNYRVTRGHHGPNT